jgi:two-component system cell cycle sensor histidine kinase/response regulator CckA
MPLRDDTKHSLEQGNRSVSSEWGAAIQPGQSGSGLIIFAESGACRWADAAAAHVLGVPRERLLCSSWPQFRPTLDSSFAARAEEVLRFGEGTGWTEEVPSEQGPAQLLRFQLWRLEILAEPLLLVLLAQAPREETETLLSDKERYQALADATPDLAFTFDRELNLIAINRAAARSMGAEPREMVGRHITQLGIPEDLCRRWEARCGEVLRSGLPAERILNEFTLADGRRHLNETSLSPVTTSDGKIVGVQGLTRDITEVKQAEELLRSSEQRFRTLFECASDGIVVHDLEGRVLEANSVLCTRLGLTREQFLGRNIASIHPPDESAFLASQAQELARTGLLVAETADLAADGTAVPVEVSSRVIEEAGRPVVLTISRDISERKRAEEALLASNERYQLLADATSDAMYSYDANLVLRAINRAAADVLGLDITEALNKPLDELGCAEETLTQWKRMTQKVLRTGAAVTEVVEEEMPDGRSSAYETVLQPILDDRGQVAGFRGESRDVTERRRMEKSLALTQFSIDHAADLIYWLDSSGRLVDVSERTVERLGYSREELLEMAVFDFTVGLRRADWPAIWETAKHKSYSVERVLVTKQGDTFPVAIVVNYLAHEGREYHCVFARNISEQKRAEEALRESEEQLRQSQKMEAVGQLAGGIAHDFNNSLTIILGYSELALSCDRCDETAFRDHLGQIKAAAEHSRDLTRQILAFSRRQTLRPEVVSLNSVIEDGERLLRYTLGEHIELHTTFAEELGLVEVDPGQLGQVLINLALNARDAMPHGGRLSLETANVELDEAGARAHPGTVPGRYAMLSVSDTGLGMNPETLAHIFEPFFTTKAPDKGTGLGLATVYGIIRQSGGSIYVQSQSTNPLLPERSRRRCQRLGWARRPFCSWRTSQHFASCSRGLSRMQDTPC